MIKSKYVRIPRNVMVEFHDSKKLRGDHEAFHVLVSCISLRGMLHYAVIQKVTGVSKSAIQNVLERLLQANMIYSIYPLTDESGHTWGVGVGLY
jgi:predicted transcriptional regulator